MQTNELCVFYKCYLQTMRFQIIYCVYKEDLALNNLRWFICHKTKSNQTNDWRLIEFLIREMLTQLSLCK